MSRIKEKLCMCSLIGAKQIGAAMLAFSAGIVAGLFLPIYIIAVMETLMIILLGYFCLFVL